MFDSNLIANNDNKLWCLLSGCLKMVDTPRNVSDIERVCQSQNTDVSYFLSSGVPEICKSEPCILGIDEAGRGPVLGPMVYGICYLPKSKTDLLVEAGCADSKTLTEEKREVIFEKLNKFESDIGWEVKVISPTEISNCMLRRQKYSLNETSHCAAITLVKKTLEAGANITEVFVDTVGPAEKYQAKLKEIFPQLSITVENKADFKFPVVGGASIFAKVVRDVCVKNWNYPEYSNSEEKIICGSGYPGDPDTKKFLTNRIHPIFGFPNLVRFSWSTSEKILDENAITVEWEEIEEETQKKPRSVKAFFKSADPPKESKFRYFKDRNLTDLSSI